MQRTHISPVLFYFIFYSTADWCGVAMRIVCFVLYMANHVYVWLLFFRLFPIIGLVSFYYYFHRIRVSRWRGTIIAIATQKQNAFDLDI